MILHAYELLRNDFGEFFPPNHKKSFYVNTSEQINTICREYSKQDTHKFNQRILNNQQGEQDTIEECICGYERLELNPNYECEEPTVRQWLFIIQTQETSRCFQKCFQMEKYHAEQHI